MTKAEIAEVCVGELATEALDAHELAESYRLMTELAWAEVRRLGQLVTEQRRTIRRVIFGILDPEPMNKEPWSMTSTTTPHWAMVHSSEIRWEHWR